MEISLELTLTPLQDDYEIHIINFIKNLRKSPFKILENPLSTQIFGSYNEVMPFITAEIEKAFLDMDHVLIYMKMVKSNRSSYEPHF